MTKQDGVKALSKLIKEGIWHHETDDAINYADNETELLEDVKGWDEHKILKSPKDFDIYKTKVYAYGCSGDRCILGTIYCQDDEVIAYGFTED